MKKNNVKINGNLVIEANGETIKLRVSSEDKALEISDFAEMLVDYFEENKEKMPSNFLEFIRNLKKEIKGVLRKRGYKLVEIADLLKIQIDTIKRW